MELFNVYVNEKLIVRAKILNRVSTWLFLCLSLLRVVTPGQLIWFLISMSFHVRLTFFLTLYIDIWSYFSRDTIWRFTFFRFTSFITYQMIVNIFFFLIIKIYIFIKNTRTLFRYRLGKLLICFLNKYTSTLFVPCSLSLSFTSNLKKLIGNKNV